MAIQQFLISKLLQPLQHLTANWSEKTKDRVFVWCGLLIILHSFLQGMGVATYRFLIFFAVDCVFLGGMILASLRENMKPVRFRKFPAFCWFGIGFLMLLAGVLVTDNRLPEALLFLVAYPVCFIVWNNMEREKVFSLLSRICILSFIPYTLINILLYPMGAKQYAGLMRNENSTCVYLILVFVCLLLELLAAKKFNWNAIWHLLLIGLCTAQVYYTNCRSGYLSLIVSFATTITLYFILHRKEKQWFTLGKLLACLLSIFVCVNTSFYLFQVAKLIPDEWTAFLNMPNDSSATDGEFVLNLDALSDWNDYRLSFVGKTLDRISTGRISIWKAFSADLNLVGNEDGNSYYIPILGRHAHTTHNTILQIGYEFGIPAGILYLIYNLFSGIFAIIFARRHRGERYALMPFAVTISFGILSLFLSLGISFYHVAALYYYFVQFPLIVRTEGR